MATRNRVVLAVAILLATVAYGALVIFFGVSPDGLSAFLGVIVGAAIVEASRHRNAEADRRNQLRLAALERRLQAHQDAFSLWRNLNDSMATPALMTIVHTCEKWLDDNIVYLEPKARQAFVRAFAAAGLYQRLVETHAESSLVQTAMQDVKHAGSVILQGVALPPLSDLETRTRGQSG